MHDSLTVIFNIKIPKFWKFSARNNLTKEYLYLCTIWHVDPCINGDEDSCDWFGSRKTLENGWVDVYHDEYKRLSTDSKRAIDFIWYKWSTKLGRPWWKHPRFHIHHWRIQLHLIQQLKRWLFSRCGECGNGFSWRESGGCVIGSWDNIGPSWFKNTENIRHIACYNR